MPRHWGYGRYVRQQLEYVAYSPNHLFNHGSYYHRIVESYDCVDGVREVLAALAVLSQPIVVSYDY